MSIHEDIFNPSSFDEYIGQDKAKALIKVMLDAADREDKFYPNFLLCGTAGQGKTSLAKLIYDGLPYRFLDGATVNKVLDELYGFLIIDEIHNLKPETADSLNLLIDSARVHIVGCTTNPGDLPGPFRSRFQTLNLAPYTEHELMQMMRGVLDRKGTMEISDDLLMEIAKRGRQTPRITLKYLSFTMDLMVVNSETVLMPERLNEAFYLLGLDGQGLSDLDHKYLDSFPSNGKPVGLNYLMAVLSLDKETIEDEIEPYLLHLGLIDRTKAGRVKVMTELERTTWVDSLFEEASA